MARPGLPATYIRRAGGNLALAWKMKKAASRSRSSKNPRRKRYPKGTRARPTVISRGIKRGRKYTVAFGKRSSFACPKPTAARRRRRKTRSRNPSVNPRRRRRTTLRRNRFGRFVSRGGTRRRRSRNPVYRTRTRRRRRRNPGLPSGRGILRTLKQTLFAPDTYITVGAVGLGALGSVALTRFVWRQTVGRFAPAWSVGLIADVAVAGLATAVGTILGRLVTKRPEWQKGIAISAGVLASATLIRNLVAMVSPQAASYLGDYVSAEGLGWYGGAMPAPSYVGDYVSAQGLGACNPALGECNPSMFESYGGLGIFHPPLQEIPGEAMIY